MAGLDEHFVTVDRKQADQSELKGEIDIEMKVARIEEEDQMVDSATAGGDGKAFEAPQK